MRAIVKETQDRFMINSQLAQQFGKRRESVYETLDSWTGWWRDILWPRLAVIVILLALILYLILSKWPGLIAL